MTLNELQKECLKVEPKYLTRGQEALLGLMGLNGAAGKCLDLYKKTLFNSSVLDEMAIVESLSDAVCYICITAHAVDVDLESIMKATRDRVRFMGEDGKEKNVDGRQNLQG